MTSVPPPPHLPGQWLAWAVAQWPDRLLLSGPEAMTFRQVQERVEEVAGWMRARKIGQGDRVVMVMPNRAEVLWISLAALQTGVVFSILSHQMQPEGLVRILDQCTPKAVFLDGSTGRLGQVVKDSVTVCVDDAGWTALAKGDDTIATDVKHETPGAVSPGAEDLAFLVFTSGSTGTPRGVMLSQGNVGFVCPAIQARLGYEAGDRIGLFLPLAFDYSFYQVFYACLTGASLFIGRPEMVGPELPKILAREGITVLPGVPTVFAVLIKMQRFRPLALPALRMMTNTGDHLPRAYIEQIQGLLPQVQVYPMFGLTECKRVSILLPEEMALRPDSVGRALDGSRVFTVDEEGRPLPAGEAGELAVQGPHLALGYWQAPEETAKRFREVAGVRTLFSGDQGRVDAEGYITFLSRSDFVIKHRGTRLNPAEVEEAACLVPGVAAAGCLKDEPSDLLWLFVTTSEEDLNEAEVLRGMATRLERAKLPDRVVFLPELPHTHNQKLDRKALRNLLPSL